MLEYLDNYLEDLKYQLGQGLDTLNDMTSGTPEFATRQEAKLYILDLEHYVLSLKIDDANRKARRLEKLMLEVEDSRRVLKCTS